MITLQDVRKDYGNDVAIGPVNLEIPTGGITALVGPNGAGKSTLLTMIGRLLAADSGTVSIGGTDITQARSKDLAKVVSILRQENHFVTRLTVRQLVGFGRFPYSGGRLTEQDEEIVSKYIDFLGLGALEGRFLDQLSGGQRQRLSIARAIAHRPDILVFDDSFSALDVTTDARLRAALDRAAAGVTRIVVAQRVATITDADQIIVLDEGRVVGRGTHAELLADNQTYREIVDSQLTAEDVA